MRYLFGFGLVPALHGSTYMQGSYAQILHTHDVDTQEIQRAICIA